MRRGFARTLAACLLMIGTGCTAATPATIARNPGFVAVRPSNREWDLLSRQTKEELGTNNCLGEKLGWWLPNRPLEDGEDEVPCPATP